MNTDIAGIGLVAVGLGSLATVAMALDASHDTNVSPQEQMGAKIGAYAVGGVAAAAASVAVFRTGAMASGHPWAPVVPVAAFGLAALAGHAWGHQVGGLFD
jgi:hypothetical protein